MPKKIEIGRAVVRGVELDPVLFGNREVKLDTFSPSGSGKFIVTAHENVVSLLVAIYATSGIRADNIAHADLFDVLCSIKAEPPAGRLVLGGGYASVESSGRGTIGIEFYDESKIYGWVPGIILRKFSDILLDDLDFRDVRMQAYPDFKKLPPIEHREEMQRWCEEHGIEVRPPWWGNQ